MRGLLHVRAVRNTSPGGVHGAKLGRKRWCLQRPGLCELACAACVGVSDMFVEQLCGSHVRLRDAAFSTHRLLGALACMHEKLLVYSCASASAGLHVRCTCIFELRCSCKDCCLLAGCCPLAGKPVIGSLHSMTCACFLAIHGPVHCCVLLHVCSVHKHSTAVVFGQHGIVGLCLQRQGYCAHGHQPGSQVQALLCRIY